MWVSWCIYYTYVLVSNVSYIAAKCTCKCIHITLVDSVDGRPTYNIEFPDSTGIDSMYGEEIGNGLSTGNWSYNEDYKITTAN